MVVFLSAGTATVDLALMNCYDCDVEPGEEFFVFNSSFFVRAIRER